MVHFMTSVLEVFHKIILPLLDVINPLCLDVPPVPPDPSPALDRGSAPTHPTQQPKPTHATQSTQDVITVTLGTALEILWYNNYY